MARTTNSRILDDAETVIDEIIARCGGDMRGAVQALLLVNEQLEFELNRVHSAAAFGSGLNVAQNTRCTDQPPVSLKFGPARSEWVAKILNSKEV